jgi:hypothetical protein
MHETASAPCDCRGSPQPHAREIDTASSSNNKKDNKDNNKDNNDNNSSSRSGKDDFYGPKQGKDDVHDGGRLGHP